MQTLPRTPVVDQIFGQNKAPLAEVLDADFAELRAEIAAMEERIVGLPGKITSEADLLTVGEAIKAARALTRKIDGIRTDEKKPLLDATRGIDTYFNVTIVEMLQRLTMEAQGKADAYVRAEEARRRAEAERLAREAREREARERERAEAARSASAAANAEARAEAAAAEADEREAAAAARAADLMKVKGAGVTTSAMGVWKASIVDYNAAIAPLGALGAFLDQDAVQKALNSMAKVQKAQARWPGVTFAQSVSASFR